MDKFWDTVYSIDQDHGWRLFSAGHILWLTLGAFFCLLLALLYARSGEKPRRALRLFVAIFLLADIAVDQILLVATKHWTFDHLPLHMCSLGGFIIAAHAFARKHHNVTAALTYAISFPGAVLALATPNWAVLPFLNFFNISSFAYHFLLIAYPFMLIAGGYRPQFGHMRPALPFIAAGAVVIFTINKLLHTDFLFINGAKTVGWLAATVNVFGIYGYLWIFPVIMAALWTIEFLPFYFVERRAKRGERKTDDPA